MTETSYSTFGVFIVTLFACVIMFTPSMVAYINVHPHRRSIYVLNLFLGWTGVVWVGLLAWAVAGGSGTLMIEGSGGSYQKIYGYASATIIGVALLVAVLFMSGCADYAYQRGCNGPLPVTYKCN